MVKVEYIKREFECFYLFVGLEADLEEREDCLLYSNTNTSNMQTIVQQLQTLT